MGFSHLRPNKDKYIERGSKEEEDYENSKL
jgi:hypothetical protein